VTETWRPALGFPPPGYRVFTVPQVEGGVARERSLALVRSYVDRHPEQRWLQALLPGFAYPADAPQLRGCAES
jgi:hypothetical protein